MVKINNTTKSRVYKSQVWIYFDKFFLLKMESENSHKKINKNIIILIIAGIVALIGGFYAYLNSDDMSAFSTGFITVLAFFAGVFS